jgi:hypothetical protein
MDITKKQIQQLNAILTHLGMQDEKPNLIHSATEGRTTSTKEMTSWEAMRLIEVLNDKQSNSGTSINKSNKANRQRRAILHICYSMHVIESEMKNSEKIEAINRFIENHTHIKNKKLFSEYNHEELSNLYFQFKTLYKHYLKKI